jgi:peptide deformylase
VLSTPTRKVIEFDDDLAQLIEDMFENNRVASGAGLAAPQIGDDRAVFVYDCRDDDGVRHTGHVVNPEVVVADGQLDGGEEGCLSYRRSRARPPPRCRARRRQGQQAG